MSSETIPQIYQIQGLGPPLGLSGALWSCGGGVWGHFRVSGSLESLQIRPSGALATGRENWGCLDGLAPALPCLEVSLKGPQQVTGPESGSHVFLQPTTCPLVPPSLVPPHFLIWDSVHSG